MLGVTQPLLCFWVNLVFVSSPTIIYKLSEASSDSGVALRNAGNVQFLFSWEHLSSINKKIFLTGVLGTGLPF